jgi:hypothetical protein
VDAKLKYFYFDCFQRVYTTFKLVKTKKEEGCVKSLVHPVFENTTLSKTVPKSNRKIVERGKINTPYTHNT